MKVPSALGNRLGRKLFASHLVIVLVGTFVYAVIAQLQAPTAFSHHIEFMRSMMDMNSMMGTEIRESFLSAINEILLISGLVAAGSALVVSSILSWRIVNPIRALLAASERISAGDYSERLVVGSDDELGQLARSFNAMAQALDETETRRMELIGNLAHELRSPLSSIRSMMEALVDGVLPADEETFLDVQREAARLERLSDDLVELSRAEADSMAMDFDLHNPKEVCLSAARRLEAQFVDKGIALEIDVPNDLPLARMDDERILQVLINLLGNALQYTETGGEVQLQADTADGTVVVTVGDTGVGLDETDLSRVFERFYRVDKSRSRAHGGSGIGLAISRHIVRAHGGRIWAESDGPGLGSRFRFTLPAS